MTRFYIFLFRAGLGAVFALILVRMFYPKALLPHLIGLWAFMVGMAYVFEYFRKRQ